MNKRSNGQTDKRKIVEQIDKWKISPFYRTLSPIGATAQKPMKVDLLDFLPVLEEKRGDFGYLLVNLVVLKIEVCFSFMKINHNLVEGG